MGVWGTLLGGQVASAATEPVQGAGEKGLISLELLRMATAHDLPTPCLWPLCPPLTTLRPLKHTVLDLDSAVKWLERSGGQLRARGGGRLH